MSGLRYRGHNPPLSPTNQRDDDFSWLEFLQASARANIDSRASSTSTDRKRRYTGGQGGPLERRPHPDPAGLSSSSLNRSQGASMSNNPTSPTSGASKTQPIDLVTPPAPPRIRPYPSGLAARPSTEGPSRISGGSMRGQHRRESEESIVSKWQSDAEVTHCPVCKSEFTFWYRKHHCRKCGRVVCSNCSPHRITIPRQYIVQPPNPYEETGLFDRPFEPDSPVSKALGGGETVRVCNPCVPDPWTPDLLSEPRNESQHQTQPRPLIDQARNAPSPEERSDRYRYMPALPPPWNAGGRSRSASHQPVSTSFSRSVPGPQPVHPSAGTSLDQRMAAPSAVPPAPRVLHAQPTGYRHRYSHSHVPGAMPSHGADIASRRPPISTAPSAPPQPEPRREVREEDECPVCGMELAPGEALRESHIQECIASRFSGTPSSSTVPPHPSAFAAPPSAPSAQPTAATEPSAPSLQLSRPRATSYRPRGMALYKATEKDCTDESGESQECIICFEDFQPGDDMGRMECLCKFHRPCITGWWERKGTGSCPTHQLHE